MAEKIAASKKERPLTQPDQTPPITPTSTSEVVPPQAATPPSSIHHSAEAEKPVDPTPAKQNFFAGFQDKSTHKKYGYILFAIFASILLGMIFLLKPHLESLIKPANKFENYIPVSQEPKSMHLEISNPDDELLSFDKTINISGKTSPKSSVVISNGDNNWGVDASDQGGFSKVIDLKPGINTVSIYGFDPQGNNKVETRTIYYSEEKI